MHDTIGKYLYVSPACKEILKYEEKELIGQDAFFPIHPDDHELTKTNQQTLRKLNPGYKVSTSPHSSEGWAICLVSVSS